VCPLSLYSVRIQQHFHRCSRWLGSKSFLSLRNCCRKSYQTVTKWLSETMPFSIKFEIEHSFASHPIGSHICLIFSRAFVMNDHNKPCSETGNQTCPLSLNRPSIPKLCLRLPKSLSMPNRKTLQTGLVLQSWHQSWKILPRAGQIQCQKTIQFWEWPS
jgi:hypothetical protein